MKDQYFYLVDGNTQWFHRIVESIKDDSISEIDQWKVSEVFEVDMGISGEFLHDIFERETISHRKFTGKIDSRDCWWGWSISKSEYNKIKKLIELYPKMQEYFKLLNS